MADNRTVVVAGPTASGKTTLAVALASRLHGEIISADSRQVYRGMDLGTGKDLNEYGAIPYHCIDIAEPSEIYTLFHYQNDCYRALSDCFARSVTPLICGGTGLYIEAVLGQYKIPNVPEDESFRDEQMKRPHGDLEQELREIAPDIYAETDCSSTKRIVRSLEIARARTRGPISYSSQNAIPLTPTILVTHWEPEKLRQRITTRMNQRFDAGMIEEVEALRKSGVTRERLDLFGLEYREINRYLDGLYSRNELYQSLETGIHQFAKRQRTWFRGMERRGFTVHWIEESSVEKAWSVLSAEGFVDGSR